MYKQFLSSVCSSFGLLQPHRQTAIDVRNHREAGTKQCLLFDKQVPSNAYFSTLKVEINCSSEISVDLQRSTKSCIAEDRTHNHRQLLEPQIPQKTFVVNAERKRQFGRLRNGWKGIIRMVRRWGRFCFVDCIYLA